MFTAPSVTAAYIELFDMFVRRTDNDTLDFVHHAEIKKFYLEKRALNSSWSSWSTIAAFIKDMNILLDVYIRQNVRACRKATAVGQDRQVLHFKKDIQ